MNSRRIWAVSICLALMFGMLWWTPWVSPHAPRSRALTTPAQVEPAQAPAHRAPRAVSATGRAQPAPIAKPIDLAKLHTALERLEQLSATISQRQLDEEAALMRRKAEEFAKVEAPAPARIPHTDERGQRWVRLEYPSGEVRYEFPAD